MTKPLQPEAFLPDSHHTPEGHPRVLSGKTGILLVNLGTPDATDYWSMRRYLKEFLSDERVIETNRTLWWFILNFIILTKRPSSSGEAYKKIWNNELDESPLRTITRSQSNKIADALSGHPEIIVDWAMRYGNPPIKNKLEQLKDRGCDRILIFPLYPQYCAATTATVYDKAFDALKTMRWQPTIRGVHSYHDDQGYISALATTLQDSLAKLDFEPEVILASFHGIPKEYFEKGDPYSCYCEKTVRLLREATGLGEDKLRLTFQSRFGKAEWIQPYTDKTVEALAKDGVKNLAIITPGFAADCVETLEEIAMENGDIFKDNGGENFAAIPCLNDSDAGIKALVNIIKRELGGWI
ncbi:MAG: ferrochelatase [Methyloligellaceae bacterium]